MKMLPRSPGMFCVPLCSLVPTIRKYEPRCPTSIFLLMPRQFSFFFFNNFYQEPLWSYYARSWAKATRR